MYVIVVESPKPIRQGILDRFILDGAAMSAMLARVRWDRIMDDGVSTRGRLSSLGEEIANSVSHGVGFLSALVAAPFLVLASARRGGSLAIAGASVFAGTMLMLYLASTLYHALPRSKAKRVFQIIDHSAIFLLIAGTYTPFTLGVLRGLWGWTLFGVVWGLAVLGVTLRPCVVSGTLGCRPHCTLAWDGAR